MRTGRLGSYLFTSNEKDSEEHAAEGRRVRPSDPWLTPAHVSVERDLVWGGYIGLNTIGKPLPWEGIAKIEREVNDFHTERMISPPQTSSLEY